MTDAAQDIPRPILDALNEYELCSRNPGDYLKSVGKAPYQVAAEVLDAIRAALAEARRTR